MSNWDSFNSASDASQLEASSPSWTEASVVGTLPSLGSTSTRAHLLQPALRIAGLHRVQSWDCIAAPIEVLNITCYIRSMSAGVPQLVSVAHMPLFLTKLLGPVQAHLSSRCSMSTLPYLSRSRKVSDMSACFGSSGRGIICQDIHRSGCKIPKVYAVSR